MYMDTPTQINMYVCMFIRALCIYLSKNSNSARTRDYDTNCDTISPLRFKLIELQVFSAPSVQVQCDSHKPALDDGVSLIHNSDSVGTHTYETQ